MSGHNWLLRLYPAAWRQRYGEEFLDLLRSRRLTPGNILDVFAQAMCQRVHALVTGGLEMKHWTHKAAYLSLICTLPAWLFLAVAAGRLMQPTRYQPAHSALLVFNWQVAAPHWVTALLLWVLPGLGLGGGAMTFWAEGRRVELRSDVIVLAGILKRRATLLLSLGALLLAVGFGTVGIVHLVAG